MFVWFLPPANTVSFRLNPVEKFTGSLVEFLIDFLIGDNCVINLIGKPVCNIHKIPLYRPTKCPGFHEGVCVWRGGGSLKRHIRSILKTHKQRKKAIRGLTSRPPPWIHH